VSLRHSTESSMRKVHEGRGSPRRVSVDPMENSVFMGGVPSWESTYFRQSRFL